MRFILIFYFAFYSLFSACSDTALAGYSVTSLRRAAAEGDFSFAGSVNQEFAATAAKKNYEMPLFLAIGLLSKGKSAQATQAAYVLLTSAAGLSRDRSGGLSIDPSLQRKIPFLNRAAALFRLCSTARNLASTSSGITAEQRAQLLSDIIFLEKLLNRDNKGFLIPSVNGKEFELSSLQRFGAAERALSEALVLAQPLSGSGPSIEYEALALRRLAIERRYNAAAALFFRIVGRLGFSGEVLSITAAEYALLPQFPDSSRPINASDAEKYLFTRNFLSASGRALLYSNANPANSAAAIEYLLNLPSLSASGRQARTNGGQVSTQEARYALNFYLARICAKIPERSGDALAAMESSLAYAPTDEDRDFSLWYMFDIARSNDDGNEALLKLIEKHISQWRDPEVFSDILSSLTTDLTTERNINELLRLERVLPKNAPAEIRERISFSLALISPAGSAEERSRLEFLSKNATRLYYRLRSSELLGKESSILNWKANPRGSEREIEVLVPAEVQKQAETLVKACRAWNLPSYAAVFAEEFPFVRLSAAKDEAQRLIKAEHYAEGARLISIVFSNTAPEVARIESASLETMQMLYPQAWRPEVAAAAKGTQGSGENGSGSLTESLIFAIIRQESFFDPKALSHAGAKGLMQLMDMTAAEVAGKLNVKEYNLFSPETSIQFGSFYLSEMKRRLEGETLQAVSAYNAGIGRVRRWLGEFPPELPGKSPVAEECLFVESVPFSETRNYAKRVFTSQSVYSALYY